MTMQHFRWSKTIPFAAAASFMLSGCLLAAPPPARPIAYTDGSGYGDGPVYGPNAYGSPNAYGGPNVYADADVYAGVSVYGGNIAVHYDSAGLPYYYEGRTVRYVPRSHPRYREMMQRRSRHYRSY